jgi:2'-5' RNA ligase
MPATPATTICAFVALELPRLVQAALAREIDRLREEIPNIEWVEPFRTHLTLRFLGWTSRERLDALEPHLAAAAKNCPPLTAPVAGLGTFPPSGPDHARVLWVGADLPRSGKALHAACEAAAEECGFPPERRRFRAHVTLGYWKVPARPHSLPDLDLGPVRMERLVLFRTEPGKMATHPGTRRAVSAFSKLGVFPLG